MRSLGSHPATPAASLAPNAFNSQLPFVGHLPAALETPSHVEIAQSMHYKSQKAQKAPVHLSGCLSWPDSQGASQGCVMDTFMSQITK